VKLIDLNEYLSQRPYPGRGVLLGSGHNGTWAQSIAAYFIMGRSENSRNRVFEETEDGIRTRAFDESKMTDPSLIIYHPVRMVGTDLIVTNGDQTDTIRDHLVRGGTFEEALRTREYEPDEPNWTPRISGLLDRQGNYRLSILKEGQDRLCQRQFFEYQARYGVGHLITTYEGYGAPQPSFHGEPVQVRLDAPSAEALADQLWNSLDESNRVSLYVCYIDRRNGFPETVIINKHSQRTHTAPKTPIWKKEV